MAVGAGSVDVPVDVPQGTAEVRVEDVKVVQPVVEQGDGFYWMEQARYWEERCLRAESVNPLSPSELEQERDYWMKRARKAETTLRQVSIWTEQMERALKGGQADE